MKNTLKKIPGAIAFPFVATWDWIASLFKEEYELTAWFHAETTISGDGMKTVTRSRKIFKLSSISKKTPTHIVGKDENGFPFEIRTVEPFDFLIRKTQ